MKLALGTVQFGLDYGIANKSGRTSLNDAREIVGQAYGRGIDTLDTAIGYGDSEKRLGEIGIKKWRVVSKLPGIPDECADVDQWVASKVVGSLRRTGLEKLYGLLLHRPEQLLEKSGEKLYQALRQMKQAGLVQNIGVSIYAPEELYLLTSHFDFDLVQAPLNLMDRRLVESGWMERLVAQGTELHVRSVFLQGLLLLSLAERPQKFDRWFSLWSSYDAWLKQAKLSPLQACLRYVMSFPEVSRVIVGVDSLLQLNEILHAVEEDLSEAPPEFHCSDPELLNPGRWAGL